LAVSIASVDLVPPADLVFAKLPAKVHDPTLEEMGKIAQAHLQIFDQHAHVLNGPEVIADFFKGSDIVDAGVAPAPELRFCSGFFDLVFDANEDGFSLPYSLQMLFEVGDEPVGLGERENALQVLSFFTVRHEV
jgi:hypothetical protein